jgi:excinuclease ABC subunit C
MDLESKLKLLPDKPGVYLMKDNQGNVIYVGKASSLKQRVRSYFQKSKSHSAKVISLVEKIKDIDTIIVDSPVEALILECNLIKQYRPKYNVRLRDDKHYPYIKILMDEEFPRLLVVRAMKPDGAKYFGPYTSSAAMKETLKILREIFPLRSCKQRDVDQKNRACLNAHINRCMAPCTGEISPEEYRDMVRQVILFLEGRRQEIVKDLEGKMYRAAEELKFEKAARIRDQIICIRQVIEKQKVENDHFEDRDVIALIKEKNEAVVQVFFVRGGKITGKEHFFLANAEDHNETELLAVFLQQYYGHAEYIPREIVVQWEVSDGELITQWLSDKRGTRVHIHVPQRGAKKQLLDLVARNADIVLRQHQSLMDRRREEAGQALEQLRKELSLFSTPHRIECYDISNIQGTNSVGSMVVFTNGEAQPSLYRRFKIKTVEGPNDFASLQEVITRRIRRGRQEREDIRKAQLTKKEIKFADFPDLIIIDGGKGQLSAVKEVLDSMELHIPVFGLAKEFEYLFRPGESEPIVLERNSPGLYLIQRLRDEAHRFAISYHRKLRSKQQVKSLLDDIPGVGPVRKKALLKVFGSVDQIFQASIEELEMVEGMNRKVAEEIYHYLQKQVDN